MTNVLPDQGGSRLNEGGRRVGVGGTGTRDRRTGTREVIHCEHLNITISLVCITKLLHNQAIA